MKLDPLFSVHQNQLIKIADNSKCDLSTFKQIEISWAKVEIEEDSYNEEFLANLREELKPLDNTNNFVILLPKIDKPFENPQQIQNFISTINHSARRIKDCTCIAGIILPEELLQKGVSTDSPVCSFMETIAIKHAQYIYFATKNAENKYNLSNANFFSSLVII